MFTEQKVRKENKSIR